MASTINRRGVLVGAAASVGVLTLSADGFAAAPRIHEVTIKSFEFEPKHIVVSAGDTIRWTNMDLVPHTATATEGGWDAGEIVKGASRMITVTDDMETNYFCAFHPHMKGTIELV